MPKRIQLSRKKGWRMPANTIKCDRSTRWGNPFKADLYEPADAVALFRAACALTERETMDLLGIKGQSRINILYMAADWRRIVKKQVGRKRIADAIKTLRGKNLACWCKPGAPCHADVLLELANGEKP